MKGLSFLFTSQHSQIVQQFLLDIWQLNDLIRLTYGFFRLKLFVVLLVMNAVDDGVDFSHLLLKFCDSFMVLCKMFLKH